ncbi:MAG: c-type cytochrome [Acidimicrobiales bacterium]
MLAVGTTNAAIAGAIGVLLVLGWGWYLFVNNRESRPELGSEVELAANRKPFYDDEKLEGFRVERLQLLGVLLLAIVAIGLPAYWIFEPGRQSGASTKWETQYATWGSKLFASTADGGFNCAGCHGGMKGIGGQAPASVTDPNTGELKSVNWNAPAVNTVLYKFSKDEVRFILVYGRPFSPMSPWGLAGGGPMNDQQIDTLIAYLESIQLPQEGCTKDKPLCNGSDGKLNAKDQQELVGKALDEARAANPGKSDGELLFNLAAGSGAYSCARCHTGGWSYGTPGITAGGGAIGPNLTGGSEVRQFPAVKDNEDFICRGSEYGKKYGQQGQGSGKMPGFCGIYTDAQISEVVKYIRSL